MEPTDSQLDRPDLNGITLPEFADFLRQSGHTSRLIQLAYDEDMSDPAHDWTGELMFTQTDQRQVQMRARQACVVSGLAFMNDLLGAFSPDGEIQWSAMAADGDAVESGAVLAEFSGNARQIVALERTMLNLIARLSAVATRTAHFVSLVQETNAKICDTRKTTPGLRAFEKYAVRCGGGTTHRMGLYDAVLIKDNHLAGIVGDDLSTKLESVAAKINTERIKLWFVQVEVDTLDQLSQVLSAKPGTVDIVLLDNMNTDELSKAVALRDAADSSVLLEASGGVSESTVTKIAQCGVDRISIGGLTHQAQSIDIGLDAL